MSYADTLLADGERIIYRTKQHWLAPLATARWAIMMVLLSVVLFVIGGQLPADGVGGGLRFWLGLLTFIVLLVGVLWIALVYVRWNAEDYLVTDRRVIKLEGVLTKHAADSSLDKINDAVVEQRLLGRMLGYGDLEILTAAEVAVDRYSMLNQVLTFKRQMLNAKHDMEMGIGRRVGPTPPLRAATAAGAPAAGPAAPAGAPAAAAAVRTEPPAHTMSADEVTDTLARLADLRDRGAITPEEYEAKKADLLNRI